MRKWLMEPANPHSGLTDKEKSIKWKHMLDEYKADNGEIGHNLL